MPGDRHDHALSVHLGASPLPVHRGPREGHMPLRWTDGRGAWLGDAPPPTPDPRRSPDLTPDRNRAGGPHAGTRTRTDVPHRHPGSNRCPSPRYGLGPVPLTGTRSRAGDPPPTSGLVDAASDVYSRILAVAVRPPEVTARPVGSPIPHRPSSPNRPLMPDGCTVPESPAAASWPIDARTATPNRPLNWTAR